MSTGGSHPQMLSHIRVQILTLHVYHTVEDYSAFGLAKAALRIELAPRLAFAITEILHFFHSTLIFAILVHSEGLKQLVQLHFVVLQELLQKTSLFDREGTFDLC